MASWVSSIRIEWVQILELSNSSRIALLRDSRLPKYLCLSQSVWRHTHKHVMTIAYVCLAECWDFSKSRLEVVMNYSDPSAQSWISIMDLTDSWMDGLSSMFELSSDLLFLHPLTQWFGTITKPKLLPYHLSVHVKCVMSCHLPVDCDLKAAAHIISEPL